MILEYNGILKIDNKDINVIAKANYYYSPGTMYRHNGDPGDPPEEELEIIDVQVLTKTDVSIETIYDSLYTMSMYNWKIIEDS